MVAQQILVLLVQVRALVEQQKKLIVIFFERKLFNGVMVAQQILVLLVQVRALVEQQKKSSIINLWYGSFFIHNGW